MDNLYFPASPKNGTIMQIDVNSQPNINQKLHETNNHKFNITIISYKI